MKKLIVLTTIALLTYNILHSKDEKKYTNIIQQINSKYEQKQISKNEQLINLAHALFSPDKLDDNFRTDNMLPIKCGTGIIRTLKNNLDKLSTQDQRWLQSNLARPFMQHEYNTEEGHFKIHYNTNLTDIVYQPYVDVDPQDGKPDYVNRVGDYLEYVRYILIDSLNFYEPPRDNGVGGDDRYDVYLETRSRAYGVTYFEAPSTQYPDRTTYISYITLHPNYWTFPNTPDENAQITAAHEYFHAIQGAYDLSEDIWFMEISSTWMEDICYDDVNDYYNYLPDFFDSPHVSITTFDGEHEYASAIWAHFLTEKFEVDIIKKIWNESIYNPALTATDIILNTYATDLSKEFGDFTTWNYFTGSRTDSLIPHYSEARNYPEIAINASHHQYPVINQQIDDSIEPGIFAANYLKFYSDGKTSKKVFFFNGSMQTDWETNSIQYSDSSISKSGIQNNQHRLDFPNNFNEVIIIPANVTRYNSNAMYDYSVQEFSSGDLCLTLENSHVTDKNSNDDNDRIEPGETGELFFEFKNYCSYIPKLKVTLRSNNSNISIQDSTIILESIESDEIFDNSKNPLTFQISSEAIPQTTHFSLRVSVGDTLFSNFQVAVLIGYPPTLFVSNSINEEVNNTYIQILDSLNLLYDYVNIQNSGDSNLKLEKRETLIWLVPEDSSLSALEIDTLKQFLQKQKNLILIGQNLNESLTDSSFFKNYLNADFKGNTTKNMLVGMQNEFISQGRYIGFDKRNKVKAMLSPRDGATALFSYINEDYAGAVKYDNGYKTVFFSFSLTDLKTDNTLLMFPVEIIERTLQWFLIPSQVENKTIAPLSQNFILKQNYPNPFNQETVIQFFIPDNFTNNISLKIYNVSGQLIHTLIQDKFTPGIHQVTWDGKDNNGILISSGIYILSLAIGKTIYNKKLTLLK